MRNPLEHPFYSCPPRQQRGNFNFLMYSHPITLVPFPPRPSSVSSFRILLQQSQPIHYIFNKYRIYLRHTPTIICVAQTAFYQLSFLRVQSLLSSGFLSRRPGGARRTDFAIPLVLVFISASDPRHSFRPTFRIPASLSRMFSNKEVSKLFGAKRLETSEGD
jgi:hypothetical protein